MSGYNVPPWSPRYGWRRGSESVPTSELRVSDAERHEVVDALSNHFADGRLAQSEFDERMGKAMSAKTQGDLSGLLVDLPSLRGQSEPSGPTRRRSRGVLVFVAVGLLFLVVSGPWWWNPWAVGHATFPFLILVFIAFFLLRRSWRGWHYHHPADHEARGR